MSGVFVHVADDYSATVPVPVCDILLKIGAIM